jgi:hypothetical protein
MFGNEESPEFTHHGVLQSGHCDLVAFRDLNSRYASSKIMIYAFLSLLGATFFIFKLKEEVRPKVLSFQGVDIHSRSALLVLLITCKAKISSFYLSYQFSTADPELYDLPQV